MSIWKRLRFRGTACAWYICELTVNSCLPNQLFMGNMPVQDSNNDFCLNLQINFCAIAVEFMRVHLCSFYEPLL
ncbi:hypothetical protein EYC80_001236 [Monilinia laxa]|uniref:Uncharacterized protein n=1 Tax=Monilinia laxa TaxID=61186 RepID=A0A5N6K8N3_MONLA|nr:hypothetical protein EYC80_001236 [Monilinia laxa]